MLPALPYLIAALVGLGLCAVGAGQMEPILMAQIAGGLSAICAMVTGLAQKIETKLGEFEKVEGLDKRVALRLHDRVRARRHRLAWKRAVTFAFSAVAATCGAWATRSPNLDTAAWLAVLAVPSAMIAAAGTITMFFESSSLDDALADLRRYVESAKNAAADLARLKKASADEDAAAAKVSRGGRAAGHT